MRLRKDEIEFKNITKANEQIKGDFFINNKDYFFTYDEKDNSTKIIFLTDKEDRDIIVFNMSLIMNLIKEHSKCILVA
jgi:hypothetical protein